MEEIKQKTDNRNRYLIIIAIVVAAMTLLVFIGYDHAWTGFSAIDKNGNLRGSKTLWDWMELLIIPLFGSVIALYIRVQIRKDDLSIASQERENEREIARDRYQETILQTYIDRISSMLLENNLRGSEERDELRSVARTRTLTSLKSLDMNRKNILLIFLSESGLISKEGTNSSVIDLSGIDLGGIYLKGTEFDEPYFVNINFNHAIIERCTAWNSILKGSHFENTTFDCAKFAGSDFSHAYMKSCDIQGANMNSCEFFEAELDGSTIRSSEFRKARMKYVYMSNTNLSYNNFNEAYMEGAILDGSIIEDNTFFDTFLAGASFENTIIKKSSFLRANFERAKFINTKFENVDLSKATFKFTQFADLSLVGVKLDGVVFVDNYFENVEIEPERRHLLESGAQ